jgi:hypothetical protein
MARHYFKRTSLGTVNFTEEDLQRISTEIAPLGAAVTVTREVKDYAYKRLDELAHQHIDLRGCSYWAAIRFVGARHKHLLRFALADVREDRLADVGSAEDQ